MTSDFFKNLQKAKALDAERKAAVEKKLDAERKARVEKFLAEKKEAAKYLDSGCDKDEKKDSQGAIEDYTKAIKIYPTYTEAYANRGCAKEELGDQAGALADWKKAADLGDKEAAKWIKEVEDKTGITQERELTREKREKIVAKAKKEGFDWVSKPQIATFEPEELILLIQLEKEADPAQVDWFNKHPNLIEGLHRHMGDEPLIETESSKQKKVVEKYNFEINDWQLNIYKAAFANEAKEFLKAWNDDAGGKDHGEAIIYDPSGDGRFCCWDEQHGGTIYVPKRCMLADPDFYDIEAWEEVDKDYCVDLGLLSEEDSWEDFVQECKKTGGIGAEPMMATYVLRLSYLDANGEDDGFVDDNDLIESCGAHFEDLHEDSRWHDG
ncbi:tetratricopeptide repeat protein [Prochlorococcus sp. MIT 1341]|uniref:tetratricopeptide repeat protein n=1 Tax=Prochlorococcus sp. MIT 1341 TaxID=3096221 RepID=UPI002A7475C1|nr:tetratricopeptide repeat protein [Prochlorococcus sp. MIT 1341]